MKKVVTAAAVLMIMFSLTTQIGAQSSTPGSEGDPVVTKSYVDSQIAQLKNGEGGGSTYQAVQLTAGQKLLGNEGTELILRSGEATIVANGENGVSDVTGAMDLLTGQEVAQNHLLLIPRSDGRGILAATEVWIMIRGTYSIQ